MSYQKLGFSYGSRGNNLTSDPQQRGFNYAIEKPSISDNIISTIQNNTKNKPSNSKFSYLGFYKNQCNSLDARTFSNIRDKIYGFLEDDECPSEMKILFGDWIFRKMYMYYKIYGEKKGQICSKLYAPIESARDVVIKGEYLKYHDIEALNNLCENFYLKRFNDKDRYFILQMLNDASLVKNFNYKSNHSEEELKQHFLRWVNASGIYEQKSNLLDVLLREYPKDKEVLKVYDDMRFQNSKSKDIYSDAQNVHSMDKTAVKVAEALLNDINNQYATVKDVETLNELKMPIANDLKMVIELPGVIEWREYIRYVTEGLLEGIDIPNIDKSKAIECTIERLCIDTTRFGELSFTTAELFIGILSFINNYDKRSILHRLSGNKLQILIDETEHMEGGKRILRERLLEEIEDMKELCISGYVTRLMNVLQGFDERYLVLMSFDKQLYAVLSHRISKALEKAPEKVVYGTFEEEYKEDYLRFLQETVNKCLPEVCKEYGAEDVGQCIIGVISSLSNHKGWVYESSLLKYNL